MISNFWVVYEIIWTKKVQVSLHDIIRSGWWAQNFHSYWTIGAWYYTILLNRKVVEEFPKFLDYISANPFVAVLKNIFLQLTEAQFSYNSFGPNPSVENCLWNPKQQNSTGGNAVHMILLGINHLITFHDFTLLRSGRNKFSNHFPEL